MNNPYYICKFPFSTFLVRESSVKMYFNKIKNISFNNMLTQAKHFTWRHFFIICQYHSKIIKWILNSKNKLIYKTEVESQM